MILIVMNAREPNFVLDLEEKAVPVKNELYEGTNIHVIESKHDVLFQPQDNFILITNK